MVKYPKTTFSFWIFLWRKSFLTKIIVSCSFLLKYLNVFNLSHIILSLKHSIMYVCRWRKNQRARNKLLSSMKTLLLLLKKSPNARNFCFSLCFLSFFRFFTFLIPGLFIPLPQICRVWLTQTPQKLLAKSP